MKKISISFGLFFLLQMFLSCEQVIDVDLDTQEPKLVVEAFINQQKNNNTPFQVIKLSQTSAYFSEEQKKASGAKVQIISVTNLDTIHFIETEMGLYKTNDFLGVVGDRFKLIIEYDQQRYEAEETLTEVPEIDHWEQRVFDSFLGKTSEVVAYFQDNALEENYYFAQWFYKGKRVSEQLFSDEFFNGNLIDVSYFSYDDDSKILPNQDITLSLSALSPTAYDYLNKVLSVSVNGGNPFASPMGVIRGNIKNKTNPKNYALGYFSVSQTTIKTYRTH